MYFDEYITMSDKHMASLYLCMDIAHAGEKMMDPNNSGENNKAWTEGPYMASPANKEDLNRSYPYILKTGKDNMVLMGYQFGASPPKNDNGGVDINLNESNRLKSTEIIPTTAIFMQFAILEAFEYSAFNRYITKNPITPKQEKQTKDYMRKPTGKRMNLISWLTGNPVSSELKRMYRSISDHRRDLTHKPEVICDSPEGALVMYIVSQYIAYQIAIHLDDDFDKKPYENRLKYWKTVELNKSSKP
ncbi:MAG TPA: hypothetical protein VLL52_17715 [Anaerolineae bacterium]|nr:hypothetical protein [Anaerolineae bacterium]